MEIQTIEDLFNTEIADYFISTIDGKADIMRYHSLKKGNGDGKENNILFPKSLLGGYKHDKVDDEPTTLHEIGTSGYLGGIFAPD